MQFDADTVAPPRRGGCGNLHDGRRLPGALGIKRGDYVIKVSNRKLLDGVMETIGLGGAEEPARRLTVLRAVDKLDRLGPRACVHCSGGRKTRAATLPKARTESDKPTS